MNCNLLLVLFLLKPCSAWNFVPVRNNEVSKRHHHTGSKLLTDTSLRSAPSPTTSAPEDSTSDRLPLAMQLESSIQFLPITLATAAFFTYDDAHRLFHSSIDFFSGHQWSVADGGQYMINIVRPVLNGPVTLSISILFGTLVAMTIQTLYNRQTAIHQTLVSTVEQIRELRLMVEGFPEPYRQDAIQLLMNFTTSSFHDFEFGNVTTQSLRDKKETGRLLVQLGRLANEPDVCPAYIWEVYAGLHHLRDLRSQFISKLQTVFSAAHYANIVALASTLLFVFLLETDQDSMQFLLGFQLSICWSLLIGTYAMLAVVIYDLATPFSGIFKILYGSDTLDPKSTIAYAMALDETF